jgi:DNA-binding LacI/PurR family transcriptional regulator
MPPSKARQRAQVTIDEVARAAGVSISTVSRVLNQSETISAETTARVRATIEQLGYIPQTAAKHLAQGKTNTLGLLLPDVGNDFFAPLLRSISDTAGEAGYDLLIAIRRARAGANQLHAPIGRQNTDGLLVFDHSLDEATLRRLHEARFPLVLLYHSAPQGVSAPAVMVENESGARQIVSHLIEVHGRRRIAFLRGPLGNADSLLREHGYREALAGHGLPFDQALLGSGDFSAAPARATVARWLAEGLDFDAIFAGDDGSAIGALAALNQVGKRVPDDVALVGFDDDLPSRHLAPPLTTVRAPTDQVGREAVLQLLQLINSGSARALTLLPTELVIRQSCGCAY